MMRRPYNKSPQGRGNTLQVRAERTLACGVWSVEHPIEGLVDFIRLAVWIQAVELIVESCG